ncbi:hypothetical protein FKW77_006029 [Venturia effusa]|uniref:Heterokaryon incompatibility domain-containing protein n=1 Tax=Venturia effusa TaxID=50376 RepID=A0A517LCI0_9PEZI|nr:hypothetical protein FKW77_006029 [Venturia effusa]
MAVQIPTASFCLPCQNITVDAIQEEAGYEHHLSLRELEGSSKHCRLCSLIALAIFKNCGVVDSKIGLSEALLKGLPGMEFGSDDAIGLTQYNSILHIDRRIRGGKRGIGIGRLRIYSDPSSPASVAGIPVGKHVSESGRTNDALLKVKGWLHECTDNHERCHPYAEANPRLPTRVLDLREPLIKLLPTRGIRGRFIALSHCWGKAQLITTTSKTLSDRIQGIELRDLPPTFQDAVFICRELGVNYLWIDSLCIIQDDDQDWLAEAAKMGEVYANSYCTIAATSARDSSEGCLGRRMFPAPIEIRDNKLQSRFWISDCGDVDKDVNAEPLNTRAWVLQERILAPRTLHYTSHQLFWECFTLTEPEDGSMNTVDRKHNFLPDFAPSERTLDEIPPSWYYLLEEYSTLDMTYAKDKLVAISGLVSRLRARVKSDYHFGLWSGEIYKGLCWMPANRKLKPATHWRAPSWSWASYDGNIQYYQDAVGTNANEELEIMSCSKSLRIRTRTRELSQIGSVVAREDLVPISLEGYTDCYSILNDDGTKIGWLSQDVESEAPRIQGRGAICALVSSCEVNNNGFGNKFLFGANDLMASALAEEREAINEEDSNEQAELLGYADAEDPSCHDDEYAANEEYEGWEDVEDANDNASATITTAHVLILEPVGNGDYKRIGMGVLSDWNWIIGGKLAEVCIK